ncbi:MAG: cytidine deaminase [Candidatus Nanosalina sp. J07AB43]|jgi:Cytidine deaminase|nr:MAG: cytidine deaminase [Candidatus Nanosalina sp. J07AB43]
MLHRRINTRYEINDHDDMLAQMAAELASNGVDTYSEYGVGAIAVVEFRCSETNYASDTDIHTELYGGININISGMEYKVHAEQLAMFNLVADIQSEAILTDSNLKKIVVATTKNDHSLVCGHCLQVIRGLSDHYNWNPAEIEYISVADPDYRRDPEQVSSWNWEIKYHTLSELMPSTYVENR